MTFSSCSPTNQSFPCYVTAVEPQETALDSVAVRCLQEFAVGGNLLLINTAHVREGGPDNVMFLMRVTHVSEISSCVTTVEWRLHLGNHRVGHQQEFPRHATHRWLAPTSSDSFLRHATLTKTSLRTRTQPTKSM